MSIVGAYVDLPKGENVPLNSFSRWSEGELNSRGPEGLDVTWNGQYPEGAQVYVEWTPRVYAVWPEETEEDIDMVD